MATQKPTPRPRAELPELHPDHVLALVEGRHPRPHDALGQHPAKVGGIDGFVIRAVRPLAATVTAMQKDGTRIPLEHAAGGLWQGFAPGAGQAYVLETAYEGVAHAGLKVRRSEISKRLARERQAVDTERRVADLERRCATEAVVHDQILGSRRGVLR